MESEPFLATLNDGKWLHSDIQQQQDNSIQTERRWSWKRTLAVHLLLALCCTAITYTIVHKVIFFAKQTESSEVIHLPVQAQPKLYMNLNHNAFAGRPTPETDAAWHRLMRNINIRVSEEEMAKTKQTSLGLPEGGGTLAWLGVYHELHCLKTIRQWTYRDHYYPNSTANQTKFWEFHTDHCIEYLRQAAMCHGDTSLTVFKWNPAKAKPMLNARRSPHMCVDWHTIETFVDDRTVSHGELARLKNAHPTNDNE